MIISESKDNTQEQVINRHNPAVIKLKERFLLTTSDSSKKTYHASLDIAGSQLTFKVGDSIAIYPHNDPNLVDQLISAMGATGIEIIQDPRSKKPITLKEFLARKANLSRLTSSFLQLFYTCETSHDRKNQLEHLLTPENKPLLSQFLTNHEPLDLFRQYPGNQPPIQEICAQFGPLLPRFYSFASSPLYSPDEIHLTVALFGYQHQGQERYGVGSHFLCHLAKPQETEILAYVQPSAHFKLPADPSARMIMVGPGTGIAPFRAFMQERILTEATGEHWLFFGERNRSSDFFYESEWRELVAQGKLKLDLAFSRDQSEKVYVQHKMYENSKELWKWLEEGAYFYVCGDAQRMAKDVEGTLQKIAQEQGCMSEEAAKAYIKSLRAHKRYLADVY